MAAVPNRSSGIEAGNWKGAAVVGEEDEVVHRVPGQRMESAARNC